MSACLRIIWKKKTTSSYTLTFGRQGFLFQFEGAGSKISFVVWPWQTNCCFGVCLWWDKALKIFIKYVFIERQHACQILLNLVWYMKTILVPTTSFWWNRFLKILVLYAIIDYKFACKFWVKLVRQDELKITWENLCTQKSCCFLNCSWWDAVLEMLHLSWTMNKICVICTKNYKTFLILDLALKNILILQCYREWYYVKNLCEVDFKTMNKNLTTNLENKFLLLDLAPDRVWFSK